MYIGLADASRILWIDYLRITFPSLQQNASPLSILPGYVDVLGRKIDNTEDVLDTL